MIVPLTPELYEELEGVKPAFTIRGFASIDDGIVKGVCGVSQINGRYFLITRITEDISKKDIIRGWRKLEATLPSRTYYALSEGLETSDGFLTHFGFTHAGDGLYFLRR